MRIFEPIMPDAESILFAGDHTRRVSNLSSGSSAMSKFIKKSVRCMGCKAVIKSGCLCKQCQRCQGSLHQEVICSNRDCDIFYRRTKVRRDVDIALEALSKLQIQDW